MNLVNNQQVVNLFKTMNQIQSPFLINFSQITHGYFYLYLDASVHVQVNYENKNTSIPSKAYASLIELDIKESQLYKVAQELNPLMKFVNKDVMKILSNFYFCKKLDGNFYVRHNSSIIAREENIFEHPLWVLVEGLGELNEEN